MKKRIVSKSKKSNTRREASSFPLAAARKKSTTQTDTSTFSPLPVNRSLTSREQQVLKLIAQGCTSKDAALKLKISEKTVDSHKANIVRKLKISGIAGLVKYALRIGLISVDE